MDSSPRLKPANRPDSQGAGQQQTLHTGVTMALQWLARTAVSKALGVTLLPHPRSLAS